MYNINVILKNGKEFNFYTEKSEDEYWNDDTIRFIDEDKICYNFRKDAIAAIIAKEINVSDKE